MQLSTSLFSQTTPQPPFANASLSLSPNRTRNFEGTSAEGHFDEGSSKQRTIEVSFQFHSMYNIDRS